MRSRLLFTLIVLLFSCFAVNAQPGTITTIAGTRMAGYNGDNRAATSAELNNPIDAVPDGYGNVYISDAFNHRIRKIDTNSIITTYGGTGVSGYTGDGAAAIDAEIDWPAGIMTDDSGNVYFADFSDNVVRKIDTKGIITTIAGTGTSGSTGDGGPATDAELSAPRWIIIDKSGNMYIAQQPPHPCVRIINNQGIISTFAGNGTSGYSGDNGPATAAEFGDPTALTQDIYGNIYIADNQDQVIRKVDTNDIITTFAGNGTAGSTGDGGPATNAEFQNPDGLATDKQGNIYIGDVGSNRIRVVGTNDTIRTIAGTGVAGWSGDGGPATAAELNGAIGISLDNAGNVYITEYISSSGNNDVRKIYAPCPNSVAISPVSPSICAGQTTTLIASEFNSYTWSPSTGLNVTTGSSVIASPTVTTTYTVVGTGNGCSDTAQSVVAIIPVPPLIIQPPAPGVCAGQSITLSVTASGSGYIWNPASTLNSSTGDTVTATPSVTTTYTVTGTDSLGCTASGSDVVSILQGPDKPTITQHGSVLTSSATQGNQWVRNDTVLTGATNQTYTVTINGWYQVIVKNPANGCSSESDSLTTSGINQLSVTEGKQLSIYPNPTGGELFVNISLSAANVKEWSLQITDVLGRTFYSLPSLNHINEIDLSQEANGIYFINIINSKDRLIVPVVKE